MIVPVISCFSILWSLSVWPLDLFVCQNNTSTGRTHSEPTQWRWHWKLQPGEDSEERVSFSHYCFYILFLLKMTRHLQRILMPKLFFFFFFLILGLREGWCSLLVALLIHSNIDNFTGCGGRTLLKWDHIGDSGELYMLRKWTPKIHSSSVYIKNNNI